MAICDKTDGIAVISDLVSPVQNPKNTENRLYLVYKLRFQKIPDMRCKWLFTLYKIILEIPNNY